jgi:hypothetical protein
MEEGQVFKYVCLHNETAREAFASIAWPVVAARGKQATVSKSLRPKCGVPCT